MVRRGLNLCVNGKTKDEKAGDADSPVQHGGFLVAEFGRRVSPVVQSRRYNA